MQKSPEEDSYLKDLQSRLHGVDPLLPQLQDEAADTTLEWALVRVPKPEEMNCEFVKRTKAGEKDLDVVPVSRLP